MVCDLREVSASDYFAHRSRKDANKTSKPGANRRISNEALLAHIRVLHAEVRGSMTGPRCAKSWWRAGSKWARSGYDAPCKNTA